MLTVILNTASPLVINRTPYVRQKQNGTNIIISNQLGRSQWFPCHEHSGFQVAKIIFFMWVYLGKSPDLKNHLSGPK